MVQCRQQLNLGFLPFEFVAHRRTAAQRASAPHRGPGSCPWRCRRRPCRPGRSPPPVGSGRPGARPRRYRAHCPRMSPVPFPCATAAHLLNDTGTGIGSLHGGLPQTSVVQGNSFRSLSAVGTPSGPNDGLPCRSGFTSGPQRTQRWNALPERVQRWVPQRTQRWNALPERVQRWVPQRTQRWTALPERVQRWVPSGPNDGLPCRSCGAVESPSGPNDFAPAPQGLAGRGAYGGRLPAGGRVCGAEGGRRAWPARCPVLPGLTTSGPWKRRRQKQRGCRSTGSGRWRPLGIS